MISHSKRQKKQGCSQLQAIKTDNVQTCYSHSQLRYGLYTCFRYVLYIDITVYLKRPAACLCQEVKMWQQTEIIIIKQHPNKCNVHPSLRILTSADNLMRSVYMHNRLEPDIFCICTSISNPKLYYSPQMNFHQNINIVETLHTSLIRSGGELLRRTAKQIFP